MQIFLLLLAVPLLTATVAPWCHHADSDGEEEEELSLESWEDPESEGYMLDPLLCDALAPLCPRFEKLFAKGPGMTASSARQFVCDLRKLAITIKSSLHRKRALDLLKLAVPGAVGVAFAKLPFLRMGPIRRLLFLNQELRLAALQLDICELIPTEQCERGAILPLCGLESMWHFRLDMFWSVASLRYHRDLFTLNESPVMAMAFELAGRAYETSRRSYVRRIHRDALQVQLQAWLVSMPVNLAIPDYEVVSEDLARMLNLRPWPETDALGKLCSSPSYGYIFASLVLIERRIQTNPMMRAVALFGQRRRGVQSPNSIASAIWERASYAIEHSRMDPKLAGRGMVNANIVQWFHGKLDVLAYGAMALELLHAGGLIPASLTEDEGFAEQTDRLQTLLSVCLQDMDDLAQRVLATLELRPMPNSPDMTMLVDADFAGLMVLNRPVWSNILACHPQAPSANGLMITRSKYHDYRITPFQGY